MEPADVTDDNGVRALARAADLPLAEERVPAVRALLATWLTAANELSRTMQGAEHQDVLPATVFAHPTSEPRE